MASDEANAPGARAGATFEEVYERLRIIARRERRRVRAGFTLNTTALVHEVYLDLAAAEQRLPALRDFFGYAARAMRNLLIDHARRCARIKHGGDVRHVELEPGAEGVQVDAAQALELDAALRSLADADARAAEVVELHYFAGLGQAQIAELLGVSERTVNRDWRSARAWLQRELGD